MFPLAGQSSRSSSLAVDVFIVVVASFFVKRVWKACGEESEDGDDKEAKEEMDETEEALVPLALSGWEDVCDPVCEPGWVEAGRKAESNGGERPWGCCCGNWEVGWGCAEDGKTLF